MGARLSPNAATVGERTARDAFARVPESVEQKKTRLLTRIKRFFFGQMA